MQNDEQSIRDLVAKWQSATAAGDLSRILPLMAEDVVFPHRRNAADAG